MLTTTPYETAWSDVRADLKSEIGAAAFESWIEGLRLEETAGGAAIVAPSRFICDVVKDRFGTRLEALLRRKAPEIGRVEFVAPKRRGKAGAKPAPAKTQKPAATLKNAPLAGAAAVERLAPLPTPPNQKAEGQPLLFAAPAVTRAAETEATESSLVGLFAPRESRWRFSNFVVGESNELAYAASMRAASVEGAYSPLFLHGPSGLGKSHLMHAIALELGRGKPDCAVVYMSAEKFMYDFVSALRSRDTLAFKRQLRAVDVLLLDDVQFIAGKSSTQEEFFHTFNALAEQGRQIVLSANCAPGEMAGVDPSMRSRLSSGLVADIRPADYDLRLGVLEAQARAAHAVDESVRFNDSVLTFMARNITANVRELEGAFNRLLAHATLVGRPVTLPLARQVLRDLLPSEERALSIEQIQQHVSRHFDLPESEMASRSRARRPARARQTAMYLAKRLTNKSFPEIGRQFGGRDHSTVMYAVKRVEELLERESAFAKEMEALLESLRA